MVCRLGLFGLLSVVQRLLVWWTDAQQLTCSFEGSNKLFQRLFSAACFQNQLRGASFASSCPGRERWFCLSKLRVIDARFQLNDASLSSLLLLTRSCFSEPELDSMRIGQDVESRPSSIQHVLTADPYCPFAKVPSLELTQNQIPKSHKLVLLRQMCIRCFTSSVGRASVS